MDAATIAALVAGLTSLVVAVVGFHERRNKAMLDKANISKVNTDIDKIQNDLETVLWERLQQQFIALKSELNVVVLQRNEALEKTNKFLGLLDKALERVSALEVRLRELTEKIERLEKENEALRKELSETQ